MGLTLSAVGSRAADSGLTIQKRRPEDRVVALAGNPNVGKSTVFNGLTGMHQHTGNWPGKTVVNAQGQCAHNGRGYVLVDLPGAYSLMAHSAEEETARNFMCFGAPDAVIVVCDATCLARSMNLVLQAMETGVRVVVCVNLLDEAKRKGVRVDLGRIAERLGVPVVGVVARNKRGLTRLLDAVEAVMHDESPQDRRATAYPAPVEEAVALVEPTLRELLHGRLDSRWLALRLLDPDESLLNEISVCLGSAFLKDAALADAMRQARELLAVHGIDADGLKDRIVTALLDAAGTICSGAVTQESAGYNAVDRRLDRILTGRRTGYPIMLALLLLTFWLTIEGANYPSSLLADALFFVQERLSALFVRLGAPDWLHGLLVLGVYRVLAWVVSVMLPPMAIFFPLFTLLEDAGYLPRVAYNLDKPFQRCNACGKQALTMCMGIGCNAAGVVGCRIIDSPRERLLAILTNSFVPCNGRFAPPHKGKGNAF